MEADVPDVSTLKSACYSYIGQLNKKYCEIEIMLVDFANAEVVVIKNRRLCEVFELFERKIEQYCKLMAEDIPEFQSTTTNYMELQARIRDWLADAGIPTSVDVGTGTGNHGNTNQGNVQPPGSDRENQDNAPSVRSHSSSGSRRTSRSSKSSKSSSRLKEATFKREMAKLHEEQLKAEQKLMRENAEKENEIALLRARNRVFQANLECTLLQNASDDDLHDVKPVPTSYTVHHSVNVMSDNASVVDSVYNDQHDINTEEVSENVNVSS